MQMMADPEMIDGAWKRGLKLFAAVSCIAFMGLLNFAGKSVASVSAPVPAGAGSELFEDELLTSAYTVHIADEQHDEALQVAERAITAFPHDLEWRRRAARSAELVGKSGRALTHWLYLAEQGDGAARLSALRLTRSLKEFPVRRYLLEGLLFSGSTDPELVREYQQVSGELDAAGEAYRQLASRFGSNEREALLVEQARLATLLGRSAEAVNALNKLALLRPLSPEEAAQRAHLQFGQGDLEKAWQTSHGVEQHSGKQDDPLLSDLIAPSRDAVTPGVVVQAPAQAYSGDRSSYRWSRAEHGQPERKYFHVTKPSIGALLRYEFNQERRDVPGARRVDSSHGITERLDLASQGFAYHPALLQFNLKFSPELRQVMQKTSEAGVDSSTSGNSFNPNYQLNAEFLNLKPYTLNLFVHRLEAQSWSTYTGVTRTNNTSYGADLVLKYSLLPTTIGFSNSSSEQDGYYQSSSDWQELHLLSRHSGVTGDSNLMSTYSINKQLTSGTTNELKAFNTNFTNQIGFSENDRIKLVSNLQHQRQESASFRNESFLLSESLAWQHLKNLRSQYGFNYRHLSTAVTDASWTSLDGRLTHKLYDNLTTTLGANGSLYSSAGTDQRSLSGLLTTEYQRTLGNLGSLNLHAGVSSLYTTRKGQRGMVQVSNEGHTLSSLTETFLDATNIAVDSIVVTNSAGTTIYVRDVDYQINIIGLLVRISRLPLGAIADAQLVMVSYQYERDAGYDDRLLTQNYGISLELKKTLYLSYRYLQTRQALLAGPPPDRLSDTELHFASVRVVAGWSESGAIYENNRNSSETSYSRWEVNQSLRFKPTNWLQYSARGYYGETDYRSRVDFKRTSGVSTSFYWSPASWLRFELEGFAERVNGTLEKTTNSGLKAGLEATYRLWKGRLNYKRAEQDTSLGSNRRRSQMVQLELIRLTW